jgi:superoxide reductase
MIALLKTKIVNIMESRRVFLKTGLMAAAGVAVTKQVFSGNGKTSQLNLPGLIYTKDNEGMWQNKSGSHLPQVEITGNTVKLTTNHSMSEQHYIVRHTLVDANGNVIGFKTFYPVDEPVSEHELPKNYKGVLYATSFCNKHDFWVKKVEV